MKRLNSILLLLCFSAGMLLPMVHQAELAETHDICGHCDATPQEHSGGEEENSPLQHDPAQCASCRLAAMPIELPTFADVIAFSTRPVSLAESKPLSLQVALPRLIPYSCGPPEGIVSC